MAISIPIALVSLTAFMYVGSVSGNVEKVESEVRSAQLENGNVAKGAVEVAAGLQQHHSRVGDLPAASR